MKKNWVYYMQEGLKSMWSKKPKTNKKYAIDLSDRRREEKIKKIFELGDDNWATPDDKKNDEEHLKNIRSEEVTYIDFKECGCLPDCGCKE